MPSPYNLIDYLLLVSVDGLVATLHIAADVAVIVAVVVGLIEWSGHRRERRERAAAVDAHLRVLARQARVLIQGARKGRTFGELMNRIATQGELVGDRLLACFTTIAGEAPQASSTQGRAASEAAAVFFRLLDRVEGHWERFDGHIPDADAPLQADFEQLLTLLTQLAPRAASS